MFLESSKKNLSKYILKHMPLDSSDMFGESLDGEDPKLVFYMILKVKSKKIPALNY